MLWVYIMLRYNHQTIEQYYFHQPFIPGRATGSRNVTHLVNNTMVTSTKPHSHPPTPAENSVFTAKQGLKRKASDTDLPTKHLVADAVGPLSFEALPKLNCQQASLAKMARTARTRANRHPVAPRSLEDLVLTPDYIRTNNGETFLLWDSTNTVGDHQRCGEDLANHHVERMLLPP